MRQWILLFIIVDAIIVGVVVWWIMNKRKHMNRLPPGPSLEQLSGFSREVTPQIREYMAAFYGGDASTLAQVLPGLSSRIENMARGAGMELGRDATEAIIARALVNLRIARERDVHRAFEDARSGRP